MLRARLLLPAAAAVSAAALTLPGPASAETYCVYQGLMDCAMGMADGGTDLQAALDTAASTAAADRVVILPGTYAAPPGGFQVTGSSPLTVDGVGDATVLAGGTQSTTITMHGHDLSELTIAAPSGAGKTALAADGGATIHQVAVVGNAPILRGMVLRGPVTVDASTISVGGQSTVGIDAGLGSGLTPTVSRTEITAPTGYFASAGGSTTPFLVHRLRTWGGGNDVVAQGAHVRLDHGVFTHISGSPTSLIAQCGGGNALLEVDHVTAVSTSPGADGAIEATCQAPGLSASVLVANSVLRGFEHLKARTADSGGAATVAIDHSDVTSGVFGGANIGPGDFLIDAASLFVTDPGFLSDTNWHLAPTSPLIDAGAPTSSPYAGDMDEQPRTRGARQDIGAYEFQSEPGAAGADAGAGSGGGGGGAVKPADAGSGQAPPEVTDGPAPGPSAVPVAPVAPTPVASVSAARIRAALRAAIATGPRGTHVLRWLTGGRVRFEWRLHGRLVARGGAARPTAGRSRVHIDALRPLPRHATVVVRAAFRPDGAARSVVVRARLHR